MTTQRTPGGPVGPPHFSAEPAAQGSRVAFALHAKLSCIVVVVMVVVMAPFGWFTANDLERAAIKEASSQLSATNQMLRNMITANQDGLRIALLRLGTVFRQHFKGSFSLDAANPVVMGGVAAPRLKLNGRTLNLDNRIVRQFTRETGGSVATVFVRAGDDFLRVSTSLTKEDGTPAIATFLGKNHPGYAKILAGQAYQGQARLFGRQYMTEYLPLRDATGAVIGILFVGMDLTESLDSLLNKIGQLTVGKTGYAFVLNARKGEGYGDFLAHPTRKGKNGLTPEDGNEQVDSVRQVLGQREGVLFYRWRNDALGDQVPREKIAAVSELSELGWLIATSGYVEEFIQFARDGRDRMVLAVTAAALLSMLALYAGVGRWVISPMLRLQEELRGAGQTLRTLINAMPDMVCFKDGEGRWLEANDVALRFFELGEVRYRGQTDAQLAARSDSQREALLACREQDEAAWRGAGISRVETGMARPDGSKRMFEMVKVPLFHGDGRRKGMVSLGRDITERKQAEAHQRLTGQIFATTGEAIMVTDTDAAIVMVNPAFCRITGYTEAEVLGRTPQLLNSGRHQPAFFRAMWRALQTSGSWTGEIWNRRKSGQVYPEWQTVSSVRDETGAVTHYVAAFADLSEIRQARETAERLAWRDPLTGLANRACFLQRLEQALAPEGGAERQADVLLLNLDRFKDINEARGLAIGDGLLKALAVRLGPLLGADDLLARLDSDEFAVLLARRAVSRDAAGRDALAVAETLGAALRASFDIDGAAFHLNACIGIALFPESPGETAADILRQADMALRQAKAEGGGGVVFFETAMGEAIKARYELERELRHAAEQRELRLYLQPQVDADGRQVGAEALVRWQHPKRGLVPPAAFIPLAETSDLIVGIDRWMLAEVCRLLARLDALGRPLRLSVNISPRHFGRADFIDEVTRQLAVSGAAPARLMLEVTEGLVLGDVGAAVAKMSALTALGIHFSMDDFGTGYSSLSYLKRLPIHELKIDKSFVDDLPTDSNDVALVESILAVARHLHLQVVAEGVETPAQAAFFQARGPVTSQGYLYGRPAPAEQWLARWLAEPDADNPALAAPT